MTYVLLYMAATYIIWYMALIHNVENKSHQYIGKIFFLLAPLLLPVWFWEKYIVW